MKLGGNAHSHGLSFFSDRFIIKATENNQFVNYETKWILPPKWIRRLESKFLLSGFLVMYYQWKVMNNKMKILFASLIIVSILEEYLSISLLERVLLLPLNRMWIYGAITLAVLMNIPRGIRLLQYHGAEHKVLNSYTKYGRVDFSLAKNASKINYRCGSNIAGVFILLYGILWIAGFESILLIFVVFLMAVQIVKKLILTNAGWNKYISLLQWLTVLEPKDEQIVLAVKAFEKMQQAYDLYHEQKR
jgi:uncharacterized protein YqhQ